MEMASCYFFELAWNLLVRDWWKGPKAKNHNFLMVLLLLLIQVAPSAIQEICCPLWLVESVMVKPVMAHHSQEEDLPAYALAGKV